MNIIFFGEDSFSVVVLEKLIISGYEVLKVYTPLYSNNIHVRLELICVKNKIEFLRIKNINSIEIQEEIYKLSPDLIVVTHFEKVLKKNIIDIPKYGCINLHPSILPNYRGLAPQHWPLINGDKYTGITVHFINEGIDTGDIIIQKKLEIAQDDYVSDLQMKMKKEYGQIIVDAIEKIEREDIVSITQTNLIGSYYGRLTDDHCKIDINGKSIDAYNLIRGVSFPYMGAIYKCFRIWKAKLASKEISEKVLKDVQEIGIYFNSDIGDYIKFIDGVLIVEKFTNYEK
jgi:methionyl-tRNA formyltransferase